MKGALLLLLLVTGIAAACKPWEDEDLFALDADPGYALLSAGVSQTCGLNAEGAAWCWGAGFLGTISPADACEQQAIPATGYYPEPVECQKRPVQVSGGHRFTSMAAFGSPNFAVDGSGVLWGWGHNTYRLLGGQDLLGWEDYPRPVLGVEGWSFRTIATGGAVACGITDDDRIVCWGQEGLITTTHSLYACTPGNIGCAVPPAEFGTGTAWKEVAVGNEHACARVASGQVSCWGNGARGQQGNSPTTTCPANGGLTVLCRTAPTPVSGGLLFTSLSAQGDLTCGITTTGSLRCWGTGAATSTTVYATPTQLGPATGWVAVSVGGGGLGNANCAVRTDGTLWCFGPSQIGQISLHQVPSGAQFAGVSVGGDHACAWTAAGAAWCFGERTNGAIGDGTADFTFQAVPVQVSAPYRE